MSDRTPRVRRDHIYSMCLIRTNGTQFNSEAAMRYNSSSSIRKAIAVLVVVGRLKSLQSEYYAYQQYTAER